MWLKQSTAVTIKLGPFMDEDDGKTEETGLSIVQADVRLSKNGGNFAQKSDTGTCTHDENGWYDCDLNTTDTNTLGRLRLAVHESGALPVFMEFMVVPANVWDAFFGSDRLEVDAREISGDSGAADNLEADYDGTGYNKSASTVGTVSSVTALAAAERNEIADSVLERGVSNTEDAADTTSLTALILAALESSISGTTWTIRKTGGTTFVTKTVTVDSGADPITGVT